MACGVLWPKPPPPPPPQLSGQKSPVQGQAHPCTDRGAVKKAVPAAAASRWPAAQGLGIGAASHAKAAELVPRTGAAFGAAIGAPMPWAAPVKMLQHLIPTAASPRCFDQSLMSPWEAATVPGSQLATTGASSAFMFAAGPVAHSPSCRSPCAKDAAYLCKCPPVPPPPPGQKTSRVWPPPPWDGRLPRHGPPTPESQSTETAGKQHRTGSCPSDGALQRTFFDGLKIVANSIFTDSTHSEHVSAGASDKTNRQSCTRQGTNLIKLSPKMSCGPVIRVEFHTCGKGHRFRKLSHECGAIVDCDALKKYSMHRGSPLQRVLWSTRSALTRQCCIVFFRLRLVMLTTSISIGIYGWRFGSCYG
jgi:hypothetical protein